jgi:hypothetical protein
LTQFQTGIKNLAALSLEAGYPIEATIPLILGNAFKNIAALSLESGYFFWINLATRLRSWKIWSQAHNLWQLLRPRLLRRLQSRKRNQLRKRNQKRKRKMEEWEDYLIESEKLSELKTNIFLI